MNCDICNIIDGKEKSHVIYLDDDIICFLENKPSSAGHMVIAPIKHITILEQIDNELMQKMSVMSAKFAQAAFESLGMDGTNIIVNNGVEAGQKASHFSVNILPRKQGDGVNFEWQGKQADQEELKKVQEQLSEDLSGSNETVVEVEEDKPEEVYVLRRMP